MQNEKDRAVKKIGVLLSGCGVYDGAEIQEAVLSMLAIEEMGWETVCLSVNALQHHVVNHITGDVVDDESRNMMVEAARIARGNIEDIAKANINELDALVIPGGFGSAKNFTQWAFEGQNGSIHESVREFIWEMYVAKKAIVALCVSPIVVAKVFENTSVHPHLTIGTNLEKSPYDISDFSEKMNAIGTMTRMKNIREISIDHEHKIITAPCYMMEATLLDVRKNIQQAIQAIELLDETNNNK